MTEDEALDALFAGYGVGVGRVARRLRSASAEATVQLAEDLPQAAGLLERVLTGLGAVVAREDRPGEVRLSGTAGSGWLDMNPTLVAVVVRPGADGGAVVSVRAVAKEGLVPQRSAPKLVERLQRALTTPGGPGREDPRRTTTPDGGPEVVPVAGAPTAVIRAEVPAGELPAFFDRAFQRLPRALAEQGVRPRSAAFALYRRPPSATVDVEVGFVVDRPIRADGEVAPGALPAGRVARLVHAGGFDGLAASWQRLSGWVQEQGLTPGEVFWEVYLTQPSPGMDPAELRTELDLLLRD